MDRALFLTFDWMIPLGLVCLYQHWSSVFICILNYLFLLNYRYIIWGQIYIVNSRKERCILSKEFAIGPCCCWKIFNINHLQQKCWNIPVGKLYILNSTLYILPYNAIRLVILSGFANFKKSFSTTKHFQMYH